MAVAFDARGPGAAGQSATNVTAGTILTWSHTCTGSNLVLVVGVAVSTATDTGLATTATYNGVSMTSVGVVHSGASTSGYVQLFRLIAPATGANNVVVTMTGTAPSQIDVVGGSVSFTGVDQTTPLGTPATNTANGSGVSVNVTGTTSGNMVVDAVCAGNGVTAPGGSQTSRWQFNGNNGIGAANSAGQSTAAGSGTVAMSWTGGADFWGIIAVEVKAVAGGGAVRAGASIVPTFALQHASSW